jgi:hypothetical protein
MGPRSGLDVWGTENLSRAGNLTTLLPSNSQRLHYTYHTSPSAIPIFLFRSGCYTMHFVVRSWETNKRINLFQGLFP